MKIQFVIFLVIAFAGCNENSVSVPPEIPINQLLNSPDTVIVQGRKLFLSTYMWRSFMPISPPDGYPLDAIVYVTGTDTGKLPAAISTDAIWIVNGQQVWRSNLSDQPGPADKLPTNRVVKVAFDGPKWGPQIFVTVVVRVTDGRRGTVLLRADHQWIGRVE